MDLNLPIPVFLKDGTLLVEACILACSEKWCNLPVLKVDCTVALFQQLVTAIQEAQHYSSLSIELQELIQHEMVLLPSRAILQPEELATTLFEPVREMHLSPELKPCLLDSLDLSPISTSQELQDLVAEKQFDQVMQRLVNLDQLKQTMPNKLKELAEKVYSEWPKEQRILFFRQLGSE